MKLLLSILLLFGIPFAQISVAQKIYPKQGIDTTRKSQTDSTLEISTEITIVRGAVPQFNSDASVSLSSPKSNETKALSTVPLTAGIISATSAGRTTGILDVSATGGATYNIPISLPPGLGASVPQLALFYNSQSGNGIAGYGWNVSGTSSISRTASTIFLDNRVGGINYDQYDRFALDGQRLLLKSGVYGGDGAEYQTESYSNLKIFSRGVSPFGASYGPAYFEVQFPDGSKAFYGFNSNSRTPADYALTYSENPLGARINYSYVLNSNTLTISQINYGSIGASTGINQVNFNYGTASRAEQIYAGGQSFVRNLVLNSISVTANGTAFRNYALSYNNMTTLNYQRLTSVQELDGAQTTAFEPVYFTYGSTGDIITSRSISNLSLSGIASNNSQAITADFTGNGSMDFLLYPTAKNKVWAFYDLEPGSQYLQLGYEINTGQFNDIFPATWLTSTNKILAGQGMILVKYLPNYTYKFEMLSAGTVSPVYFQYDRVWNNVPRGPQYLSQCHGEYESSFLDMYFIAGDFNGSGLTSLIAINDGITVTSDNLQPEDDPMYVPGNCDYGWSDIGSSVHFINMDRRLTSNYITNTGLLTEAFTPRYGDKLYTGDVNGDGKTDIIVVKKGRLYVYTLNNNNSVELLWKTTDSRITNDYPLLLGDYNGDGKMDLMFSTGNNSLFATFLSTGKSFVKFEKNQPFSNPANNWNGTPGVETLNLYYLVPNDVDGDGKTDIILAQTTTKNNSASGTANVTVYHNSGPSSTGEPNFGAGISKSIVTTLRHNPIPVFLNPEKPNHKLEFGFMSDNSISLFNFAKDFRKESQITNISQDGISHTIEYKTLSADQSSSDVPLYQISYDQTYPYIDVQSAPSWSVVSKLTRNFASEQVQQVFGYAKAVTHAQGLGFLGFGEVIKSNWHSSSGDPNRNFKITIQDPMLRGATIRSFNTQNAYLSSAIKNMALSNPPPASGIADGASISDYISRSDQVYTTQLLANKVFLNVPVATANKDLLNNTFGTQTLQYDTYYNTIKAINNFGGAGSKTVEITYGNNPGTNYYMGRVLSTKTTLNSGSDSFVTQEEYTYTGFLITQVKKKSQTTPYITENMVYDAFGNVTQKTTIAPDGVQRIVSMQYDPTGRFMVQQTDADGMIGNYLYNGSTGTLSRYTNPYGQAENYSYDSWGRMINTISPLNVNTNWTYQKISNNTLVTQTDDEGHSTTSKINPLGQTVESTDKNLSGQIIGRALQYDIYGRKTAESQPNQPGSYNQWDNTVYDQYGRIKQLTSFTGKTTNITYSGLNTTVNDGTKSVTTSKNALGQVTSVQDPGGTISYGYFANGNLKTVNYGGIIQSIEQDGWGRKTKLTDPSAGQYQFEYDGFGQLTKEISPKGTTDYTFDAAGKLLSKKIIGDATDMRYTYTYDSGTKMLTAMSLSNADGNNASYSYTYDALKRLSSTVEDNLHARFVKSYTYDSYGRIATEGYEAKNKLNNIVVQKTVVMQYQNGELIQTSLQGSGQVLWKINTLDAKGRLSTALQGNKVKTTFLYDQYGLPQQKNLEQVSGTPVSLMNLGYNFDAPRGVLNSRTNSAFGWTENFTHDNLDRLTAFNDNNGNNSQTYDNLGRIASNSQLGTYTYSGNTYRQSELALNSTADAYYQTRPLQTITYNAFKSPVEIIEQGVERISFQYNAAFGRSHMYYGDNQADKMLRRYRRHYSEDGNAEITNDLQSGKTSFVFYLGGDAYSAPAIWKEVYGAGPTTQNLYYLHRDHLGSIVMITNEQGAVVEKRQFDAWGNIIKLTDGNGNALTAFAITDRGFTGHEHLLSVGLIHMNGRLYDPKLHRFLSPDNYVQDPYNTQNFNRFAYAMNNPLMYTDASGEFFWLAIAAGALFGAISGGVGYIASAIRTGDWSWGQFGMSMLTGAVIGGVTGGINPTALLNVSLGQTIVTAFVGGLLPSVNVSAGNFSFSLSPSIAFGKSFGVGANLSVGYSDGNWNISAGVGVMYYGNYQGFGKSGTEIRKSLMGGFDDGTTGVGLGTNFWKGSGGMSDFKQQTGSLSLHFGDFRAQYENDGSPFQKRGFFGGIYGDGNDSYRTAALNLSYKDLTIGFNLFTGKRDQDSYKEEEKKEGGKLGYSSIGQFGEYYKHGFVDEKGPRYRLGAAYIKYGNSKFGTESGWIGHAVQNVATHGFIANQRMFPMQNNSWNGYYQYQSRNKFSLW